METIGQMINGITPAVWGLANRLVSEETIVHPEYTRQAWFLRSCVTRSRHGIDRLCFPCVSRRLLLLHILLPQRSYSSIFGCFNSSQLREACRNITH
jgi:hypothetical protein